MRNTYCLLSSLKGISINCFRQLFAARKSIKNELFGGYFSSSHAQISNFYLFCDPSKIFPKSINRGPLKSKQELTAPVFCAAGSCFAFDLPAEQTSVRELRATADSIPQSRATVHRCLITAENTPANKCYAPADAHPAAPAAMPADIAAGIGTRTNQPLSHSSHRFDEPSGESSGFVCEHPQTSGKTNSN